MTIKDWLKHFDADLTEEELQDAEYRLVKFYAILAKRAKNASQNVKK